MLTSVELLSMIESLEDEGIDLEFNEVMMQITHKLRPDVPITIYIGGSWREHQDFDGVVH